MDYKKIIKTGTLLSVITASAVYAGFRGTLDDKIDSQYKNDEIECVVKFNSDSTRAKAYVYVPKFNEFDEFVSGYVDENIYKHNNESWKCISNKLLKRFKSKWKMLWDYAKREARIIDGG